MMPTFEMPTFEDVFYAAVSDAINKVNKMMENFNRMPDLLHAAVSDAINETNKMMKNFERMPDFTDFVRKEIYPKCTLGQPIADVIFNDPATIIFWTDGTKTVVKRGENEPYDPEKGMAMAIAKKFVGDGDTHGNYYEIFKKYLPEDYTAKKETCEANKCDIEQTADTIDKLQTRVHNLELYLNKAWNRLSVRARKKMMDDFDGMPDFIRKDEFDIVADDDE